MSFHHVFSKLEMRSGSRRSWASAITTAQRSLENVEVLAKGHYCHLRDSWHKLGINFEVLKRLAKVVVFIHPSLLCRVLVFGTVGQLSLESLGCADLFHPLRTIYYIS